MSTTRSTWSRRSRCTPSRRWPCSSRASTAPARCRWPPPSRTSARIVAAQRASGKNYMMMETAVYTRQFLYARELLASGELGRIQFLRGAHYQDMENWPPYWLGLPPMWYATHAVAPLPGARGHARGEGALLRLGRDARGTAPAVRQPVPRSRPPIFQLATSPAWPRRSRARCSTPARGYTESFNVYGENMAFEWQQIEDEDHPVLFTLRRVARSGRPARRGRPPPSGSSRPTAQDLLPPAIARFTVRGKYDDTNPHQSFEQGAGTTARTRTWSTSSCAASSRAASPGSTRSRRPTGPPPASAPTSRPCMAARRWRCRTSVSGS